MHDKKHYENPALWTEDTFAIRREQDRFRATAALIPQDARSLLDVGAGNGAFLAFLEEQAVSHLSLKGLERSESAIAAAVCRAPIQQGAANQLPFEDHAFDIVSTLEVIEHLPYEVYEQSLQELARVAEKYLLISVPYREKRVKMRCHYCDCEFNPYYHMRSFDEQTLDTLFDSFRRVKFEKVAREDYLFSPIIKSIYRTLTGNRNYIANATCPQCGFTGWKQDQSIAGQVSDAGNRLHHLLSTYAPKYNRIAWIIALYQRVT